MKTMFDAFESDFKESVDDAVKLCDSSFIEIIIPMKVGLDENVSIVDIETTGLDPSRNKLITLGMIYGHNLHIMQRMKEDKDDFKDRCIEHITELNRHGILEFYAYNCSFESRFLGNHLSWNEIMPYRIKKDECVKFDHFHFGTGKEAVAWWKKWEKTGEIEYIENIMRHNVNCLLKEFAIFSVNYSNFRDGDE